MMQMDMEDEELMPESGDQTAKKSALKSFFQQLSKKKFGKQEDEGKPLASVMLAYEGMTSKPEDDEKDMMFGG